MIIMRYNAHSMSSINVPACQVTNASRNKYTKTSTLGAP